MADYNEKLDQKLETIRHLLLCHLAPSKEYQLLNMNPMTADVFELWVDGLQQKDFSFTDCGNPTCLWNISKAPH